MEIPEGKGFELLEPGTYNAVLVKIIDIGTQPSSNPKFKPARRALFYFEAIGEKTEEGDPFVLAKWYNFSRHENSQLMKDLTSWMQIKSAVGFNLDSALGRGCQISVVHSEDGKYANISNIIALPKGVKAGKPVTPLTSLYLVPGDFDEATFNELSDKMKQKIAATKEYVECTAPAPKKGGKTTPAKAATATAKRK